MTVMVGLPATAGCPLVGGGVLSALLLREHAFGRSLDVYWGGSGLSVVTVVDNT